MYQRPTSPVNAPPEITCAKRLTFSMVTEETLFKETRILNGHWLVIVYIWATDVEWLKKAKVSDLVSFSSVIGWVIRRLNSLRCSVADRRSYLVAYALGNGSTRLTVPQRIPICSMSLSERKTAH
jgi:hypothetical protein